MAPLLFNSGRTSTDMTLRHNEVTGENHTLEGGMPLAVGDTPAAGMDVFVPNADDDDDDDGVVSGEASIGRDGPGSGSGPGSDVPAVADIRLKFVGKPCQLVAGGA
jgi:hypothetical protein